MILILSKIKEKLLKLYKYKKWKNWQSKTNNNLSVINSIYNLTDFECLFSAIFFRHTRQNTRGVRRVSEQKELPHVINKEYMDNSKIRDSNKKKIRQKGEKYVKQKWLKLKIKGEIRRI